MDFEERFGDLLDGLTPEQVETVGETMAYSSHEGRVITRDDVALFVRFVKGEITGDEYVALGMKHALPNE